MASDESSQSEVEILLILLKCAIYSMYYSNKTFLFQVTGVIQEELGAMSLTPHNLSFLTDVDVQNNENYITQMEKRIYTLHQATILK
ncbi:hypothetical protein MKY29_10460 [Psychrobacillus sp. FSL K6-2365]